MNVPVERVLKQNDACYVIQRSWNGGKFENIGFKPFLTAYEALTAIEYHFSFSAEVVDNNGKVIQMKKSEVRNLVIEYLATQVIEKAQLSKSGSAAIVPSATEDGKAYRVEVDENYNPVACQCKGGKHNCQHKAAFSLYIAPRLAELLDDKRNPRYAFQRNGNDVVARLSQFSREEKAALRAYQAQIEEEARKRAIYEQEFDVNGLAFIA